MEKFSSIQLELTRQIAAFFGTLPQVEAVAVAGSRGRGGGAVDGASDIDLYVYTRAEIPLAARRALVEQVGGASEANLGLNYWGPGDLWVHAPTGIDLDINYFDAAWMEEQIARVMTQHQPAMGYTTCFCCTVRQSILFHDPHGWFAALQRQCDQNYPEALRQNIIRYNHPVLRGILTSYAAQIEKAVKRRDLVSVNHRVAALLASYFDILFAANRLLHPGEKRQVEFALKHCQMLPAAMEADLQAILTVPMAELAEIPERISRLLDRLDAMLAQEGIAC
ncbi:MAG TPA: DUF4037 domain-containing protein [Anaerolineaceae bacterium]|nr:DUF4037 domain-containing protein [Anaerolineaceae bacterium]HPN53254.1 DUF4037 domain-containing protein [Anaerolineaceae bacterium]